VSRRSLVLYGAYLVAGGAAFAVGGGFVLGFLGEPSAVGRVHTALLVVGAGSLVIGLACVVWGSWMLLAARRT